MIYKIQRFEIKKGNAENILNRGANNIGRSYYSEFNRDENIRDRDKKTTRRERFQLYVKSKTRRYNKRASYNST